MKSKKRIILIICILLISFFIILFFYYKTKKNGNNISKSISNIEDHILNISSYEAIISVEITSNKNINKYIIKQWYVSPNIFKQEIQAPENIKGLVTLYDGKDLKIENSILDLSKIYENYSYITNNFLSLNSFIEESKDTEIIETEKDNRVKMSIETNNKYSKYKDLIIDKDTGIPIEMKIMDENKKTLVYILYNEITINNITKEDIRDYQKNK